MKKVLVLCTGNSCRSQMAEGWIRYYAGRDAEVYSAGIESHGMNKYAIRVMSEAMIDITGQYSKTIDQLPPVEFDFIITLCDDAEERCPVFPGSGLRLHRSFPDPAKIEGSEEDIIRKYSELRDAIEDYCFDFVHTYVRELIPGDLGEILRL